MQKITVILLLLPLLMGFTGPLTGPSFVCYIGKLKDMPVEPADYWKRLSYNTSLQFVVQNFNHDPLAPESINLELDMRKYRPGFFKKDRIYTIVAEKVMEQVPGADFPFGCFFIPKYKVAYKVTSISTTE